MNDELIDDVVRLQESGIGKACSNCFLILPLSQKCECRE